MHHLTQPGKSRSLWVAAALSVVLAGPLVSRAAGDAEDPFLWLEDVTGEQALDWVRAQNARSTVELANSEEFETLHARLLAIMDSQEKIPYVAKYGEWFYNFWRDEKNPRGLWRRTTLDEYRKPEPDWETVLDVDALGAAENENWVWKGAVVLQPSWDRCLVSLSRGGADAAVVREFDLVTKTFVENGFHLPEAKSGVAWRDLNTLYVGTDFGPDSLTDSGYPRTVKEWRRGTPLVEATTVFEGEKSDVGVWTDVVHDHGLKYQFIIRSPTFFTSEVQVRRGDEWALIEKPADAEISTFDDQILIRLKSDWTVGETTYRSGALLATNFDAYLESGREFEVLFEPGERKSLDSWTGTKNFIITTELENVRSRAYTLKHNENGWSRTALDVPEFGSLNISAIDSDESDDYFLNVSNFLTPSTLFLGTVGTSEREKLKSLPAFFNADGLETTQHEATSKDGTKIPYFQVSRSGVELNGSNPTLLYGYGGFEISLLPRYNALTGTGWLEKGGVYILANIRGGGEFGPDWHNAARRENRQRAYEDFIAVAEDLIARSVTSPEHLGIQGGSNGGLLMGVMLTQRPDLFKAIVCQVPLLDMKRYNKLLAGASWMDEYGNPDVPEDWAFISKYSPYQNLHADKKYPRVLFTTSTRDDRVHPGHARKMAALMESQGHNFLYYENIEGGHGGAADNKQSAFMRALAYTFLWRELK